jgi:hypothetical protein
MRIQQTSPLLTINVVPLSFSDDGREDRSV